MLNSDFYRDYINGLGAHGYQSPIVPVTSLVTPVTGVTPDEFLAYSTIPITFSGQLADSSADLRFVAMPHVFKRTKEGCGEWIDPVKAKEAGLTAKGFGIKQNTPPSELSAALENARDEAERLLHRILDVYGLPGSTPRPPSPASVPVPAPRPGPSVMGRDSLPPPDSSIQAQDERDFFYYLLAKVKAAFESTDICAYQRQRGLAWWYSICALPLRRNADLLLGLKWGANLETGHQPQTAPPTPVEIAEVRGYKFIARSRPYLERYVGPLSGFNYMNVCPFRAHKLEYLTPRDWQLAIDNFFIEAIDYLNPPMTVVIGTTDVKVLAQYGLVKADPVQVRVNGKTETGYRGLIRGRQGDHPFGAVPQPTYAMTNAAREALWAAVFK